MTTANTCFSAIRFAATALLAAALCTHALVVSANPPAKKPAASTKGAAVKPIRLCRYKNAQGVLVTSSSISPEDAKRGYQIINMDGTVLETIAPELSAEQRKALEDEKKNKISAAQQQEEDKQLLLRYSSLDELKHAKDRKLGETTSKIKMLESNQASIKTQIEFEQSKAAGFERSARPVPPVVLQKIESLTQDLKAGDSQITSRKEELASETVRFDQEIQRYDFLEKQKNEKITH